MEDFMSPAPKNDNLPLGELGSSDAKLGAWVGMDMLGLDWYRIGLIWMSTGDA
jgi:hypothetical protein